MSLTSYRTAPSRDLVGRCITPSFEGRKMFLLIIAMSLGRWTSNRDWAPSIRLMALSLSTCWHGHHYPNGLDLAHAAKVHGFDMIELAHSVAAEQIPGVARMVGGKKVHVSSIHHLCPAAADRTLDSPPDCSLTSSDAPSRQEAMKRSLAAIELAARLSCGVVIVDLGRVEMSDHTAQLEQMTADGKIYSRPYIDLKISMVQERSKLAAVSLELACQSLGDLLPAAAKVGVSIAIASGPTFECLPSQAELLALLREFPQLGVWHDFGHIQRQSNLGLLNHAEHIELTRDRILGCHVHDVVWPCRDHQLPFTGGTDFAGLMPLLPADIPMVWDLDRSQKKGRLAECLGQWTACFGL
jgi:sugar phosphate isomerase/epimerase